MQSCTTLSTQPAAKASFLMTTEAGEGAPIRTPSSFPVLSGHSLLTPSRDTRVPLGHFQPGLHLCPCPDYPVLHPFQGRVGARSLTSGCADHSVGQSWPRRVYVVERPGIFSRWLVNWWERDQGEDRLSPPSPSLLPVVLRCQSCLCPQPQTEPGPLHPLHSKPRGKLFLWGLMRLPAEAASVSPACACGVSLSFRDGSVIAPAVGVPSPSPCQHPDSHHVNRC